MLYTDEVNLTLTLNIKKKYDDIRDNISIGLAQMGKVFDEKGSAKDFNDAFDYVVIQLKKLDYLIGIKT